MKVNIKLNFNKGYRWFSKDGIYVKGYCFDENNILWDEGKLIEYFLDVNNKNKFHQKLLNANGIFCVIIKKNDSVFFATDRTRTFPLFYTIENKKLYISDDTYYLRDKFNKKIDSLSSQEYLATGYVTGKETLLENIYQVQAGEYIVYENNILNNNYYSNYITTGVSSKNFNQLKQDFLDILDRTIKRLIQFANGKQIVVPLSGGYDSRLIVSLLKMHNYKNVFCFTYGSKDSFEVDISKKVANILGYNWYFIEYNKKTVPDNYSNSKEFQEYCKFASNHVSISHIQDYFAVKYLKENKIIKDYAVIVPGHTGDFISGGHLNKTNIGSYTNIIVDSIIQKHYILNSLSLKDIKEIKYKKLNYLEASFCSIDDNFNLKERQSKFIVNANRVYEFFGYKHTIPLWDKELIEFFKTLPLKYKLNSYFYEKVILDHIFDDLNIRYEKIRNPARNLIKKILPDLIKKIIKKYILKKFYNDINNFYLLAGSLNKDIGKNYPSADINSLFSYWHIYKIYKEFNYKNK